MHHSWSWLVLMPTAELPREPLHPSTENPASMERFAALFQDPPPYPYFESSGSRGSFVEGTMEVVAEKLGLPELDWIASEGAVLDTAMCGRALAALKRIEAALRSDARLRDSLYSGVEVDLDILMDLPLKTCWERSNWPDHDNLYYFRVYLEGFIGELHNALENQEGALYVRVCN